MQRKKIGKSEVHNGPKIKKEPYEGKESVVYGRRETTKQAKRESDSFKQGTEKRNKRFGWITSRVKPSLERMRWYITERKNKPKKNGGLNKKNSPKGG